MSTESDRVVYILGNYCASRMDERVYDASWHVLPLERSQRTDITEFVGKQSIIWLKDKLPCMDRSASSDSNQIFWGITNYVARSRADAQELTKTK